MDKQEREKIKITIKTEACSFERIQEVIENCVELEEKHSSNCVFELEIIHPLF